MATLTAHSKASAAPTGSCGGSKHVQHAPAHTLILNDWMCFTGFETGRCLFLRRQIKKSVEIGPLFHYLHNTRRCPCYRWNPYIFCILLRHTDAQRSKMKQGNLQNLSICRPLKNIWRTFWFPTWSREQLCTNQTRCWLFHGLKATTRIFFQSLHSTSLHLKQTQWCGNFPVGLQSMTV